MFGRDFWGNLVRSGRAVRVPLPLLEPGQEDAAVEAWLPGNGSPVQGLIVHLHGGGNDARQGPWRLVEAALAQNWGCVLFHQAGHGSGGTSRYSRESALARVLQVFAAVQRAYPNVPRVGLGQSLGAALLLDALLGSAESGRELVSSAVVVSPPHTLRVLPESWLEARVLLQPLAWRLAWELGLAEVFPAAGPFRRERFPVRVDRERYPRAERDYIWPIERSVDEMQLLERIAGLSVEQAQKLPPLLLIHGARDRLIRVDQGQAIARALRGAGAPVVYEELKDEGHFDILIGAPLNERAVRWFVSGR